MNRRGFIASILAAASAPAIVKASSIMRVRPVLGPIVGDTIWIGEDPTPLVVTGNRLLTIEEVTRAALKVLHEKANLLTANGMYMAWPVGTETIRVRLPRG